jgi:thiamine biosynthesis lipoprotein
MVSAAFRAMGCQMAAHLDSAAPGAAAHVAQVPRWFEAWEQHLSRFRPDSELSQLNAQAGRAVRVSPTLWRVVRLALRVAGLSGGRVVPTLLAALEGLGYDRSFEALPAAVAGPSAAGAGLAAPDVWRDIVCRRQEYTICLPAGVRLDLGGVAKGWAAARAAAALSGSGPALVDAGGDIAVSGPPSKDQGWPIAVDDPRAPGTILAVLCLRQGGVATSGRDYRRWQQEGTWRHHLLDARTGLPAESDVLTATVIAPALWQAEMAAKMVVLLGAEAGLAWLDERPHLAGMAVLADGDAPIRVSARFTDHIWS